LESASKEVPNLGIATVYRNINAMVTNGTLRAVPMPGEADRYHLTAGPATTEPTIVVIRRDGSVRGAAAIKINLPGLETFHVVAYAREL
jgi:Fe2+ or Zn2+ uptake regulation protein